LNLINGGLIKIIKSKYTWSKKSLPIWRTPKGNSGIVALMPERKIILSFGQEEKHSTKMSFFVECFFLVCT